MNYLLDKFYKYSGLYKYGCTMFHAIFDVSLVMFIAYLIALGVVAIAI